MRTTGISCWIGSCVELRNEKAEEEGVDSSPLDINPNPDEGGAGFVSLFERKPKPDVSVDDSGEGSSPPPVKNPNPLEVDSCPLERKPNPETAEESK